MSRCRNAPKRYLPLSNWVVGLTQIVYQDQKAVQEAAAQVTERRAQKAARGAEARVDGRGLVPVN